MSRVEKVRLQQNKFSHPSEYNKSVILYQQSNGSSAGLHNQLVFSGVGSAVKNSSGLIKFKFNGTNAQI